MHHDPASRVMSLSFLRAPDEHADVILDADRRMLASTGPTKPWPAFFLIVGLGVAIGIATELHRRLLLPLVLGPSEIAPLGTVVLQLLPLLLLLVAIVVLLRLRAARRRRSALASRVRPGLFVDVDIFPDGIVSSCGQVTIDVEWLAVRDIVAVDGRVELECESFALYIPQRAFGEPAAFAEGLATIRGLWREALRHDRDSRMIEAGID